ncbi:MAG: hypothetical protein IKT43_05540 [Clostridia bacterium]|nr:hypothetical protein [Clostridia bacterium]
MTVFVCVDDNLGRTFLGKRQSRDRALCEDVLSLCRGRVLFLHEKSAPLFETVPCAQSTEPLANCPRGGACFSEFDALSFHKDKIDTLVLYRWNRTYPASTHLDLIPEESGFSLSEETNFPGTSHDNITRSIYVK